MATYQRKKRQLMAAMAIVAVSGAAFLWMVCGAGIRADSDLTAVQGALMFVSLVGIAVGLFLAIQVIPYFEDLRCPVCGAPTTNDGECRDCKERLR